MDVILVNEKDEPIGTMEKMAAHEQALLHRAFSVFIFNSKREMLLQQRSSLKYHSGGLWTNACCSHPAPGQSTEAAASKRLQEEMGFTTSIRKAFDFVYQAAFDNGLTEHEFDHVFLGEYDGEINPDPDEVNAYKYLEMDTLEADMQVQPEQYTAWFRIALPLLKAHLTNSKT